MMLDIAYRLAVLNPAFENSKDAEGIILIDEIDLHLHPKWQWNVLNALEKTLPNVQFIIATHSPIVISSCKNENLIMLDENQNVRYLENAYAYSIKDILELRQESYSIPKKLQQLSSLFENYLNDENYAKAKEILEEMTAQFGENNSEVIRAKWLLNLEE
jgi:predicted ATP-binding protein involved in virulence